MNDSNCQHLLLSWYLRYKKTPHMTFAAITSDAEAAALRLCLPADKHTTYYDTRVEYHKSVDKYGVNDNILQQKQQVQLNLLWSQLDWMNRARALLTRD